MDDVRIVAVDVLADDGLLDQVVGQGQLNLPLADNRHVASLSFAVRPEFRRQGSDPHCCNIFKTWLRQMTGRRSASRAKWQPAALTQLVALRQCMVMRPRW